MLTRWSQVADCKSLSVTVLVMRNPTVHTALFTSCTGKDARLSRVHTVLETSFWAVVQSCVVWFFRDNIKCAL